MMQRRPNTELTSMDSLIQILCRFQKVIEKFLDRPPKVCSYRLETVQDFLIKLGIKPPYYAYCLHWNAFFH